MSYIEARGLTKIYGHNGNSVKAVDGLSFQIRAGEFAAVMGESGSGKSTLLSILGGLLSPNQGSLIIDGLDVYRLSRDQRANFRREFLGFVFQSFHLLPYLTVMENVMLPLATARLGRRKSRALALAALKRVGLTDKAGRLPDQISGGEQERTALARAIVNQPPILLADEPTGNLDSKTSGRVMEMMGELNQEGMTVVMVTHSAACARAAERVLTMSDGRVVAESSPGEIACN
jgi:putative ABC transport system ATP-binding protein